jgi:hypothetical protein
MPVCFQEKSGFLLVRGQTQEVFPLLVGSAQLSTRQIHQPQATQHCKERCWVFYLPAALACLEVGVLHSGAA